MMGKVDFEPPPKGGGKVMSEQRGKASTRAKNKYNTKAYDQLRIVVPKGRKTAIEAHAKGKGESVNGLVNTLLRGDMGLTEADWKGKADTVFYPVVFTYENEQISITFPDFAGCVSAADTEEEALHNAREALEGHIRSMRQDGENIPTPATVKSAALGTNEAVHMLEISPF